MNKPTITKIWLGGLVAIGIGLAVGAAGTGIMLGLGGHWVAHDRGWTFDPSFNSAFWTAVGLMSGAAVVLVGGLLTQFVAWIGALINTWRLPDKLWFVLLLVLGLLRFEFVIMLVYLVAGPDGLEPRAPSAAPQAPMAPVPG